jgi:hypothetical protein
LSSNKEDNRNKFPEVAKIVDKFTEIFGKVKVIYAEEGGNTVGKKAEDGIPADQIILEKIENGSREIAGKKKSNRKYS